MTKKILIIDDELMYVEPVTDRIKYDLEGVTYFHTPKGNKGISEAEKNEYDLIILDMMLPLEDISFQKNPALELYGLTVLEKIRVFNNNIPIICYTVFNEDEVVSQIKQRNGLHICKVQKYSFDELFDKIQEFLK